MIEKLQSLIARLLKLPPEPPAPYGDYVSVRVFRASRKFFTYNLILWGIKQVGALIGLIIGLTLSMTWLGAVIENEYLRKGILFLEIMAIPSYLFYLVFSFLTLKLDYEQRWYKVTDRSLRIREGIVNVQEMTMTFANIQNIKITQGPIQRLLGISDLLVQTAGGGGMTEANAQQGHAIFNMHVGYFRGVDNAEEIMVLMKERLRKERSAGLGEDDDVEEGAEDEQHSQGPHPLVDAATRILAEAKALRHATERS